MIVYRDATRTVSATDCLTGMASLLRRMSEGRSPGYDEAADLIISMGEIESAVTDALCPDCDRPDPAIAGFRKAGTIAGHIFCNIWRTKISEALWWIGRLRPLVDELAAISGQGGIRISVPEGYAFYGLFPEMYYEAAGRCFSEIKRASVVCIGIRSIGTSLSSVVAAALEERGCQITTLTLRPRGHAFDRTVTLSGEFKEHFRSLTSSYFLIIDEGPGLSGSSFCCIARLLSDLGIGDERIAFFPSWEPDAKKFVNTEARLRWPRHRSYHVSFEDTWLADGRLGRVFGCGGLVDVSAGKWRMLFYENESESPAVFPNAERRKYLCLPGCVTDGEITTPPRLRTLVHGGNEAVLAKFAGLGRYGRQAYSRARRIARAGFSPPVLGLIYGFLLYRFIPGRPMSAHALRNGDVDRIADYLAFLYRHFPSRQARTFDETVEMVRCNVREGLGPYWIGRFERSASVDSASNRNHPVAGDGRMLPHEWIGTENSFIKTDETDHHTDHFFPGCQDIAWDIAGCIIEFGLRGEGKGRLLDRCIFLTGDRGLRERLPFYSIAYSAYRLGFATLAADTLGATSDGDKFRRLAVRYAVSLKKAIDCDN